MHLIIPYAASFNLNNPEVLAGLQLPHLQALLALMQRQQVLHDTDPMTQKTAADNPLHMPHERLYAHALGWDGHANALPWAAWHSAQNGQPNQGPQAWMTPCHWQVGMDQVVMLDPTSLYLTDDESQQLLEAMQSFLREDGLQVTWHSALAWHAQGELLAHLNTASLDRVIGQNVKPWLNDSPAARPLRRLQSEMQMLLYNHPVNDAREARKQHTVNSFWLHGAGVLPAVPDNTLGVTSKAQQIKIADALRTSALRGDVQTWQQAWQTLDATVLADLLAHLKTTGQATLSLCSENAAHTYQAAPAAWHQKISRFFNKTTPVTALQALLTP